MISEKFPEYAMTPAQVKCYKNNHHIKSNTKKGSSKGYSMVYTEEIQKFITENYKGIGPKKMASLVNSTFGTHYTRDQLKAFYGNHRLNSGVTGYFREGSTPMNKGKKQSEYMSPEAIRRTKATRFKTGHRPHNAVPVGTVARTTNDGYLVRKVAEPDRWEFVHRAVWEKANGPVPDGMVVSFKDGNRENCDISNLMLVSRAEHSVMNHLGLRFDNADLTEAGLLIAKIKLAQNRRNRN